MDTKDAVTTTSAKSFRQKAEIVSLNLQKRLKKHIIQKIICLKIPLSRWMQCWPPRRNFPRSLREW